MSENDYDIQEVPCQIDLDGGKCTPNEKISDEYTPEKNTEEKFPSIPSSAFKSKFLLKSFIFVLEFNLTFLIPVLVLVITGKDFYNEFRMYCFLLAIIICSFIGEENLFSFMRDDKSSIIISIIYGLSIMGFFCYLPYPKCTLTIVITLCIDNVVFILIALIPFSGRTICLMYTSSIAVPVFAMSLLQLLPVFHSDENKNESEYMQYGVAIVYTLIVTISHSYYAHSKVKEINKEKYELYFTQIFMMSKVTILFAYLTYYFFKIACYVIGVGIKCIAECCRDDAYFSEKERRKRLGLPY